METIGQFYQYTAIMVRIKKIKKITDLRKTELKKFFFFLQDLNTITP